MKYIFVSDIFGKTAHLSHFAKQFNTDHLIVDPYNGELQAVTDDEQQYAHFMSKCNHNGYANKLNSIFENIATATTVIAFSAGGAAAWRSIAHVNNPHIKKLIAFYPNQVRHYLDVISPIPCELIFTNEQHFDIHHVIKGLSAQKQIMCTVTDYKHGFMNPLSTGFNSAGYQQLCRYLLPQNNPN